jgi:hypothetical protein
LLAGLTLAGMREQVAQVVIVPGSRGGFNRIDALNDRIAAFIEAQATDR